jgi:hypothetical protein
MLIMASYLMPSSILKTRLLRWLVKSLLAGRRNSVTLLVNKVSTLAYREGKLDYKSIPSLYIRNALPS